MADKAFLRTEIGERVEQSDFEHATSTGPRQIYQSLVSDLIVGDAASDSAPRNFVIHGFESDDGYGVLPGTIVTINGGKAIVGLREAGEAEFGMIISGGSASRNRDMNGLQDGTWGVYVRAEFKDDRFLNRLFWNPLAVTPVETPRNIATRRTEDWTLTVELVSPGPEWILIAQAVKLGSQITLTDRREHFFEGQSTNSYAAVDAEWGGGTDRDPDRAVNGAHSLRRAIRGLQRQVQDIIGASGPSGWYRSINRSLLQLVALDGSRPFAAHFTPDGNGTRDIGDLFGNFWRSGYFTQLLQARAAILENTGVGQAALIISDGSFIMGGAGDGIECDGDIESINGDLILDNGSISAPFGSITCLGTIQNTSIGGDIIAGRHVQAGAFGNVSAGQDVSAGDDVLAGDDVAAVGDVTAGGVVTAVGNVTGARFVNNPVKTHYHWVQGSACNVDRYGGGALGTGAQARGTAANNNAHIEGPRAIYSGQSGLRLQDDDGSSFEFEWDLHLPDGVTVTGIDISMNITTGSVVLLRPVRTNNVTVANTDLRSPAGQSLPVHNSASSGLFSMSGVNPFVIDNASNTYKIKGIYLGSGTDVGIIYAIRVSYTMGEVNGA